jgi:hypothetical protein
MFFPTARPDSCFSGWLNARYFAAQRLFIRRNLRRFTLSFSTIQDDFQITKRLRVIASMEAVGSKQFSGLG